MWETVSKGTLGKWSMSVKGQMKKNKGCVIRHRHGYVDQIHILMPGCNELPIGNKMQRSKYRIWEWHSWLGKLLRQDQSYQDVFYNFYRGVPSDQTNCRCFCMYVNQASWMKVNLETIHHLQRGYTLPFSFPVATKSVSVWVHSISLGLIYTC